MQGESRKKKIDDIQIDEKHCRISFIINRQSFFFVEKRS